MQLIYIAVTLCLLVVFVESKPNKNCDNCAEESCGINENGKCCPGCKDMKAGACPKVEADQFGTCAIGCQTDENCDGQQKCCSNGCGYVCTNPVKPNCGGQKAYNNDKCATCRCSDGLVSCYYYSCLLLHCENGYKYVPGKCCPVCK